LASSADRNAVGDLQGDVLLAEQRLRQNLRRDPGRDVLDPARIERQRHRRAIALRLHLADGADDDAALFDVGIDEQRVAGEVSLELDVDGVAERLLIDRDRQADEADDDDDVEHAE